MVDDEVILLALRARLLTLSVATTGAVSLSATASGYARVTGSFKTNGFKKGMEVNATGFINAANNGPSVVREVADLTLEVDKEVVDAATGLTTGLLSHGTVVEVAGGGRQLLAGLPRSRAWENVNFEPNTGVPYVEEDYLAGPNDLQTVGPGGRVEALPMYVIRVYANAGSGIGALYRYARALLDLFPPKQSIALASGDPLRVRGQPAPFRGQLLPDNPGWSVVPVTIPLRLETVNAL